ncbi:MAG: hypothetical protein RBT78_13020 [Kiritimatiellia bacterium]|jgi:lipoprotein-anchoring transpeptidase ErfK/SrfK|nr:hypothetical protein [Kiritimatiellia bacterium]
MNLTSKRMMVAAACAGLCALASVTLAGAPTAWWVADSFETSEGGAADLPISQYKDTITVEGATETTNFLWVADGLDASKIIATNSTYSGTRPGTNSAPAEYVLDLATEGSTLTRHVIGDDGVSTGKAFTVAAPVYVDTLIQFRPSEDTPTIGEDVKVAVYVNINSNLVVYHATETVKTNSVFDTIAINPEQWYRLTIQMTGYDEFTPACKVYLDGENLTHANAIDNVFFLTAATGGTLNAVAFQGTGLVDDLAVANDADFGGTSAILLTLAYDAGLGSVLTNGAAVGNGGTVESGTLLTINAAEWHRLLSVTGDGDAAYVGETGLSSCTGIVSATASANVAVTFTNVTGNISMGGESVDAEDLAAWAAAQDPALTEAAVQANAAVWYDEYLLNIAPDEAASTIEITSITVGATEATIVVTASSTAVDFSDINGTLNVYTTDDLGTAFGLAGSFNITPGANGTATVTVPLAEGSFIKATVE